jgi:hypothetical protein
MKFVIPGCVLSRWARLSVIFVVATVGHVIAAYLFLGKDKPRQMLVGLPITYLAVALVWIVIRMVSRRRDVNTKALATNKVRLAPVQ